MLYEETEGLYDIMAILDRMERNCPQPSSTSQKLWKLRRATYIAAHNTSKETMLEKSVAKLAQNGQMPGWFNQCPTASGIGGSNNTKRANVDLVHWAAEGRRLTLVELKWGSNSPSEAVQQVLRYGATYLFCRKHRKRLPVGNRPAMTANQVALRVVAPAWYYNDDYGFRRCLTQARESLRGVSERIGLPDLSMSLDVLAFPKLFDLPFANGAEVNEFAENREFEEDRRRFVAAFDGLASVIPTSAGAQT